MTEDIRLELLDLYGRGYVIDHCMASIKKQNEVMLYRIYTSETLMMIAENTAKMVQGRMPSMHYADIIGLGDDNQKDKPKTTEDVVVRIRSKFRNEGRVTNG